MFKKLLSPPERYCEILFGLIMVLTFTGTLSVLDAGKADIKNMLLLALGCNLVWGIIDATFYLIKSFVDRSRFRILLQELQRLSSLHETRKLIRASLPKELATSVSDAECDRLAEHYHNAKVSDYSALLTQSDFFAALSVFLLVFLSTLPVVFPFLIFTEPVIALRVSNITALLLLFFAGDMLAKYTHTSRLWMGLLTVGLGVALVSLVILLGG